MKKNKKLLSVLVGSAIIAPIILGFSFGIVAGIYSFFAVFGLTAAVVSVNYAITNSKRAKELYKKDIPYTAYINDKQETKEISQEIYTIDHNKLGLNDSKFNEIER